MITNTEESSEATTTTADSTSKQAKTSTSTETRPETTVWLKHGGTVTPGFESVRDLFLANFEEGGQEDRAQVCIYVRGERVVDLWASRVKSDWKDWGASTVELPYSPSSLQMLFSSSKVLTSLVVALLADRGHLKYDALVTDYWPEFPNKGCAVAMLMRHEAGFARSPQTVEVRNLTTESIKAGKASPLLEKQIPAHAAGEKRDYHGLSRGYFVNELVRRADPEGRTIGEILAQDITAPLGLSEEVLLGIPERLHDKIVPLVIRSKSWMLKQCLLPHVLGGGRIVGGRGLGFRLAVLGILPIAATAELFSGGKSRDFTVDGKAPENLEAYNSPDLRAAELPSVGVHASARGLALIANAIVRGGAAVPLLSDGSNAKREVRIISEKGIASAQGDLNEKKMFFTQFTFDNAGWCHFTKSQRHNFIGWMGFGGSCVQWHQEEEIAFGYAQNSLMPATYWNAVALALQEEVLSCINK